MIRRLRKAREQLGHLAYEVRAMNGDKWWRWGNVWFTSSFLTIASYRLSRAAYMALGRGWPVGRVALSPLLFAMRPWTGGSDIHYQADIDRGLRVLHPSLGVVVSARTKAGKNLILTGGNCIGRKPDPQQREVRLGDNVMLGANAAVIGPLTIGNDVKVGAGATVVRDTPDGSVLLAQLPYTKPRPDGA